MPKRKRHWTTFLPEENLRVEERLEYFDAKIAEIKKERKEFMEDVEFDVNRLWTPKEIAEAKKAYKAQ